MFDWTKIEGYREDMTSDEKIALLENYDPAAQVEPSNEPAPAKTEPTPAPANPNAMKGFVPKAQLDKVSSELAAAKKQLKTRMTEEEQREADRQAEQEAIKTELETLRRDKTVSSYKASCLALNYDEALADEVAVALAAYDIAGMASSAITGSLLGKLLGFSKLGGAGIGLTLDSIAKIVVKASDEDATNGGGWESLVSSVWDILKAGLGAALTAIGLGLSTTAGVVIGVGTGLVLAAIVTINRIINKDTALSKAGRAVSWGAITLTTKNDIETMAKKLLDFDVGATVDLVNVTLGDTTDAQTQLNGEIATFNSSLNLVKIGVDDLSSVYTDMKTQLLGEDGQGGILKSMQELLNQQENALKVFISVTPPTSSEGEDMSTSIYNLFGLSNDALAKLVTQIGNDLGGLLTAGTDRALLDWEQEAIADYANTLIRIQQALSANESLTNFYMALDIEFNDLDEASFTEVLSVYNEQLALLEETYRKSLQEMQVMLNGQLESAKIALEHALKYGTEEEVAYWSGMVTKWEEEIAKFDPAKSLEEAMEAAKVHGKQVMAEWFAECFDSSAVFDTRIWDDFINDIARGNWTEEATIGDLTDNITALLQKAIEQAAGKDYEAVLEAQETFGFTNWDILSTDVQMQMFQAYSEAVGSEKTIQAFGELGYDLNKTFADAILSEGTIVENAAGEMVITLKDGTKVAVGKWDSTIVSMFDALGVDIVDGMVTGIDGEMTDQIQALLDIFGIPYEKAVEENEVNSPSELFKRLGVYIVEGLIAGLGTLATKLKDTWSTLPAWFQTFVNKIVGMGGQRVPLPE